MDSMIGNLNSAQASNSYSNLQSTKLENHLNQSDLSQATDDELMKVCKDFESYFVEQVMKSAMKMADVDGDGSSENMYASLFGITEQSDSGMSTMASYFGDQMVSTFAKTVTEAQGGGSLGLAQQLYEQMKRNYGTTEIPGVEN